MKKILVLCTGNSARSQLAQGYLQHFADMSDHGDRVEVFSAGVNPKGVNPLAIQVMAEDGIDISHHTSNHADDYVHIPFDYVITVCDNAREQCPFFPTVGERIHQSFPDPGHTASAGTAAGRLSEHELPDEDALTSFRRVRDLIKVYSKEFIESRFGEPAPQ